MSRENFWMPGFRTANESGRMRGSGPSRKSSEPRPGRVIDTVAIGPERYNDLYEKFGNLNSLLGWGHARVIENLLAKKPDCPRALSDKFADARVIERALLQHGRKIHLEQRTKAESDLAVAAASILAREAFIDWLDRRGKAIGTKLGRGVSAQVKEAAKKLVETEGPKRCARSRRCISGQRTRSRLRVMRHRPPGASGAGREEDLLRPGRQGSCYLLFTS